MLGLQSAASIHLKERDVTDEERDDHGRWTSGGGLSWPTNVDEFKAMTIDDSPGAREFGEAVTESGQKVTDDTPLILYHSTDRETADNMLKNGVDTSTKPSNLTRMRLEAGDIQGAEFAPGRGAGAGLYLTTGAHESSGYGSVTLAVMCRAGDLEAPPELEQLGSAAVPMTRDMALSEYQEVMTTGRIPPEDIREIGTRTAFTNYSPEDRFGYVDGGSKQIRLKDHDVSGETRDDKGKWTDGGGGDAVTKLPGMPTGGQLDPGSLVGKIAASGRYDLSVKEADSKGGYSRVTLSAAPRLPGDQYKAYQSPGIVSRSYGYDSELAKPVEEPWDPNDKSLGTFTKFELNPDSGYVTGQTPQQNDGTTLFRGMSYEEMQAVQNSGQIATQGMGNIVTEGPGKEGTAFTYDPRQAQSYASGFAMAQNLPAFGRPSYIVGVTPPADAKYSSAYIAGSDERQFDSPVPASAINSVVEVRPYAISSGEYDLVSGGSPHYDTTWRDGSSSGPTAQVAFKDVTDQFLPKFANKQVHLAALVALYLKDHDVSDEERDERGRWTAVGGMPSLTELPQDTQAKIAAKADGLGIPLQTVKDNLETAFKAATPDEKAAGMTWYSGAHTFAEGLANKYNLTPEQATGIVAAISPMRDWDSSNGNKIAADTICRTLSEDKPFTITQERADEFNKWAAANNNSEVRAAAGTLEAGTYKPSDLSPAVLASVGDLPMNGAGVPPIMAAIDIYRGGSPEDDLSGPKVRSFYNNIANPDDPRSVTIDTWMYRAGVDPSGIRVNGETKSWQELQSEKYPLVKTLGSGVSKTVNKVSVYQGGLYGHFAQAVSDNAETHGMTPNQYQAIVWTHIVNANPSRGHPGGVGA